MATKKISALPAVVTPASTDEFEVNQGGTSRKETRAQIHALEVGEQFLLPLDNDAVTPSIAFGNGDTGFFEGSADVISIAFAGVTQAFWQATSLNMGNSEGAALRNDVSSSTLPTLNPARGDADTGIGHAAADALSLIAGAQEGIRLTEASSQVIQTHSAQVGITAAVGSSQGDGPILSSYNVYDTVGTAGDAATLPGTFPVGTVIKVINNAAANSMDVFPVLGDDAGLGTDTVVPVLAGESAEFLGIVANATWVIVRNS